MFSFIQVSHCNCSTVNDDALLLLRSQPGREPFLNLVAERDKLVVLVQGVPNQRDDVGEHPAA